MGFTLLTLIITKMAQPSPAALWWQGHGWDNRDLSRLCMAALEHPGAQAPQPPCVGWVLCFALHLCTSHNSWIQVTHLLTPLHLCICLQRLICHDMEGHFSRHSLHVQPGKWQSPYPGNTGLDSPCNKPSLCSRRWGENTGAHRAIKVPIRCGVDT